MVVEEAGVEVGPKSHFTEEKIGSEKVSSLTEVTWRIRQWGAKMPAQTPRLFLFIPTKPLAKIARSPTYCTLEVTSNTIC